METFFQDLETSLGQSGFKPVPDTKRQRVGDARLLLKRQTWNTNRAVVVIAPDKMPAEPGDLFKELRKQVAFQCGFIPLFWGIGIQVLLVAPGICDGKLDPKRYLARIDNQWSIIQSLFLLDSKTGVYTGARTWAQVVSGQWQDQILATLDQHYQLSGSENPEDAVGWG